jgi:alpha-galactosidase
MLPLGTMMHGTKEKGVHGPASPTYLTRDEQVTTMTLWAITRAPLMFGGRLPLDTDDTWTLPLISA